MSLYIPALLALLLLLAMVLAIMARDTIERPLTATHDTIVALCELETAQIAHRVHGHREALGPNSDVCYSVQLYISRAFWLYRQRVGCGNLHSPQHTATRASMRTYVRVTVTGTRPAHDHSHAYFG